jgi:hypothetical protein
VAALLTTGRKKWRGAGVHRQPGVACEGARRRRSSPTSLVAVSVPQPTGSSSAALRAYALSRCYDLRQYAPAQSIGMISSDIPFLT